MISRMFRITSISFYLLIALIIAIICYWYFSKNVFVPATGGNIVSDEEILGHARIPILFSYVPNEITENIAAKCGFKIDGGVLVGYVVPGSSADHAGFKRNDIIIKLQGQHLQSDDHLIQLFHGIDSGKTIQFEVIRNCNIIMIRMVL